MRHVVVVMMVALVGVAWMANDAQAQCAVCQACVSDADCGVGGSCADFGTGPVCTAFCDSTTCPGDSRCYQADVDGGGTIMICLNPGAPDGVCPSSYSCSSTRTCDALGNACPDSCGGETELCITDAAAFSFCSCYCNSDVDCGSGNTCVGLNDGRTACVPGDISTPCDGVTCPAGETCDPATGNCVGSSSGCPGLGTDCSFDGVLCTDANDLCLSDGAETICSCTCFSDADCGVGNTCATLGDGTSACVPGGGSSGEDCTSVSCPAGQVCSPATGTCIGEATDTSANTDVAAPDTFIGGNDTTVSIDTSNKDVVTPPYDMGSTLPDTMPTVVGPTQMEATGDCACDVRHGGRSQTGALGALVALIGLLFVRRRRVG